jgi:hypothetical protein
MGAVTKIATSAFQHDEIVTLNAQFHTHSFINMMHHLKYYMCYDQMCHMNYIAFLNKTKVLFQLTLIFVLY